MADSSLSGEDISKEVTDILSKKHEVEVQDDTDTVDPSAAEEDVKKPTVEEYEETEEAIKGESSTPENDQESEASEGSKEEEPEDDEEDDLSDASEEELKKQFRNQKTRNRFEKLLGSNRELKSQIDELQPDAEQFRQIRQYAEQNNISDHDVGRSLYFANLIINDPFKAWDELTPVVQELAKRTGRNLNPELRQRVQAGELSYQDAEKLSTSEARIAHQQERTQFDAYRQQNSWQQSIPEILGNWERNTQATDPDYGNKQADFVKEAKLRLYELREQGQMPTTVQGVTQFLDSVKQDVDRAYKKKTRKPAINAQPEGGSSRTAKAEPKSAAEAGQRALDALYS